MQQSHGLPMSAVSLAGTPKQTPLAVLAFHASSPCFQSMLPVHASSQKAGLIEIREYNGLSRRIPATLSSLRFVMQQPVLNAVLRFVVLCCLVSGALAQEAASPFASDYPVSERFNSARKTAVSIGKQLVVLAGSPKGVLTREVLEGLRRTPVRVALDSYDLLLVDASDATGAANRLFMNTVTDSSENEAEVRFYIYDIDGAFKTSATLDDVVDDMEELPKFLAAYFRKQAAGPRDAKAVLEQAKAEAAATGRRILFMQTGESFCNPCDRLTMFLADHRDLWDKDYLWISLRRFDDEGAGPVIDQYRKTGGALPWLAVLDASGELLEVGELNGKSIQYPLASDAKQRFREMLDATRQRMDDRSLLELIEGLDSE
jgi:hypothetical protein